MFYREKYAELDCDIDGDCKGVQSKDDKTNADTEQTWSKCSRWVLQSSWSQPILFCDVYSQLIIDISLRRHTYLRVSGY